MRMFRYLRKLPLEYLYPGPHLPEGPILFEKGEVRDSGRARKLVTCVCMSVKKALQILVSAQKDLIYLFGRNCRGKREISARNPFGKAQYVRAHVLVFTREHLPCPSDARRNLVSNHKDLVFIAEPPYPLQISIRKNYHSGCTLHKRLYNQSR